MVSQATKSKEVQIQMFYRAQLTQEGERWLIEFPDCPGCQTFGNSREHAIERGQEALEGWLESMLDLRRVPPRPLTKEGVPVHINEKLSVALQIRLARDEQGYSQAQVADRAGLSQQQVARIESPDNNPTLASVIAVAGALGLHLELVSDELEDFSPSLRARLQRVRALFSELEQAMSGAEPSANDVPPPVKATRAPAAQRRLHGTR